MFLGAVDFCLKMPILEKRAQKHTALLSCPCWWACLCLRQFHSLLTRMCSHADHVIGHLHRPGFVLKPSLTQTQKHSRMFQMLRAVQSAPLGKCPYGVCTIPVGTCTQSLLPVSSVACVSPSHGLAVGRVPQARQGPGGGRAPSSSDACPLLRPWDPDAVPQLKPRSFVTGGLTDVLLFRCFFFFFFFEFF